ncbi:MAG: ABC transporter permease [Candidatus Odinarchaeota archaeon]|nr:ABC transporter permease [Candidatus Odinarchaeota archaeon]
MGSNVVNKFLDFYKKKKVDWEPQIKELKYSLYLVRHSLLTIVGIAIVVFSVFLAAFAPLLAPYGPEEFYFSNRLLPPSSEHWFGTDMYGGDLYSRVLYGLQIDLQIAVVTVAIATAIGITVGLVSAYYGGYVDEVLMRITDIFLSFPGLILAMAIAMAISVRTGGGSLMLVMIAISLVWWPSYARLIRGEVLKEKQKLYVEAARALGFSKKRIMFIHMLPNVIAPLLVAVTLDLGGVLLTAAGLSFIGLGAPPGSAELGRMISEGRQYLTTAYWTVLFPGLAIFFVVLGFNLLGDGLRDVLDPRLRR